MIPMLVFRLEPFNLVNGSMIIGLVRAYNVKGWGPFNAPNTLG